MSFVRALLGFVCAGAAFTATFGTAVPVVGGASDLVLDEARGRLYLVGTSQARVEVYSISQRRLLNPVRTDATPISAAMSRSGKYLYVTSYDASSLNIIDLDTLAVVNRVSLPARPEGIAVGRDERVLISTIGTGANNAANVLLVYDPDPQSRNPLVDVAVTPPPPTPPQLPPPSGRTYLQSRSQLLASRDGSVIIGVNVPTGATTRTVFVYEVASATVLRSRNVTSASSVLAVAPDGSKFMTGLSLFDTATLQVIAQQNLANSPYPIAPNTNFNTQTLQGGSVFSPDGSVLYSGFDISPVQNPAARPNVSQLMLSDPDNLLINMGLQLAENLAGKMVISNDGGNIYALSESGFLSVPMSTMRQQPIAVPESTVVALAYDQCAVAAEQRSARITVRNAGGGQMTATAQVLQYTATGPGGLGGAGGAGGGAVGGAVTIILPPGVTIPGITTPTGPTVPGGGGQINATIFQTAPSVRTQQVAGGTAVDFTFSPYAAVALGTISPTHDFLIQSSQAINIPAAVRVYQNNRNPESRGDLVPIPVGISANEALEDLLYDANRQRLYIANSGRNRVEVFDTRQRRLLEPIKVGQLPRSMGLSPDGSTLYVANTGGEDISIVDVDKMRVAGRVKFPPVPLNASLALVTPSIIVVTQRGPMFITSTGQLWRIIGDEAIPRGVSPLIGADSAGRPRTITAPRSIVSTPNGERAIVLSGDGYVYLYDALADEFIQQRQVFTGTQQGYYGAVAAGPRGQYYLVNGTVLNESLTPTQTVPATTVPGRAGTSTTATTPVAAVAPLGSNTFVRFTQGVRTSATALPTDTGVFELVDVTSGNTTRSTPALEGPVTQVPANGRATMGGRLMAVDSNGSTVYAITTTGLSIIPLDTVATTDRPQINQRGAVNLASYQTAVAPNTLLSIFGRNLGNTEVAGTLPLPIRLGGVCVTMGNTPLPLFMTSSGQINAQIPPDLAAGTYQVMVRAFDKKIASASQSLTVSKYAPAALVNPESGQILLFHEDGRPVTKDNPAKRDRPITLYALGLGATKGGKVNRGEPSPSSPLAETDKVEVFFGDPRIKEAGIIVDWSGLAPGYIGLYQINLRVPGDHIRGEKLPVTIKIGGVSSPTTGPLVPYVAVD